MKKTWSWDRFENIDCFGNEGEPTGTYIWPKEKGGAHVPENRMLLSKKSIDAIGDITKGEVNGIRYSITKQFVLGGDIYGNMKIQKDRYDGWIEVVKKVQK